MGDGDARLETPVVLLYSSKAHAIIFCERKQLKRNNLFQPARSSSRPYPASGHIWPLTVVTCHHKMYETLPYYPGSIFGLTFYYTGSTFERGGHYSVGIP